jgi:arabinofuranosyltransferase
MRDTVPPGEILMERSAGDEPVGAGSWRTGDTWLLLGLCLVALVFVALIVDRRAPPYEDAAMLMRYAKNFAAEGHIVWNRGERPADGATDFLFMLALAGWCRAGLPLEAGTRVLALLAHLVSVGLVYGVARQRTGSRSIALIAGSFLALGPGVQYVQAHFGTPFFALGVLVHWILALRLADRPHDRALLAATAGSGVLLGLLRPEGVLIAGFVLLALAIYLGLKSAKKVAIGFALAFLIPGGIYLLWRWWYFTTPLPTPFLIKGEQRLHWESLVSSVRCTSGLVLPFLLAFIPGLVDRSSRRRTLFFLIPVAGMTLMWVLLTEDTNYFRRFQYPVLPMVLLSWAISWYETQAVRSRWFSRIGLGGPRAATLTLVMLVLLAAAWNGRRGLPVRHPGRDGRYEAGLALARFGTDHVLATTEAGLLPLYSGWTAVDLYGLNDAVVARRGPAWDYLDARRPDVIVFYAYYSPGMPRGPGRGHPRWFQLVSSVEDYALSHGYVLAACYGETREETHYYYVREASPDAPALVRALGSLDYYWWRDGGRCENFAAAPRD